MNALKPDQIGRPLSIGEVAARSGITVSALRFYESKGLIKSMRSAGNQRRFPRQVLRRVAVIKVAQSLGIPLKAIQDAFGRLPQGRPPAAADWNKMSARWRAVLDDRIARLSRLRDQLDTCIGCGCLSLKDCPLRNPLDRLSERGTGAQLL